jgi:hypothetical protein
MPQRVWHPPPAALGERQKPVLLDGTLRRPVLLPVGVELVERAWSITAQDRMWAPISAFSIDGR